MPRQVRIFNNLRYNLVDELENKSDANLIAHMLESSTVKTQVIPTAHGYSVYSYRSKQAPIRQTTGSSRTGRRRRKG